MTRAGIGRFATAGWRGLVGGAAVVLIVFSWSAFQANRKLAAANAALNVERTYPYPLTSLRLETPDTKVVESWYPSPKAEIERYLVLVSESSCFACAANEGNWESLLRRLGAEDHIAVWMINYGVPGGMGVFGKTLKGRVPYKVFQVTDPVPFGLKTGLIATPTTLLTDGRMRVELAGMGVMTPEILGAFERGVHGDLSGDADVFLPTGAHQNVLAPVAIATSAGRAAPAPRPRPVRAPRPGIR